MKQTKDRRRQRLALLVAGTCWLALSVGACDRRTRMKFKVEVRDSGVQTSSSTSSAPRTGFRP